MAVEIYEQLWRDATAGFARREQQLDPYLDDKSKDARRGVTLLLRPSPTIQKSVTEFLDAVKQICPHQYFYRPEELHVTVMSIISGNVNWQKEMDRLSACQPIIREALGRQPTFGLHFKGITASPGSIMIQGFPEDQTLSHIRDELREAFTKEGLGDLLDRRYKIQTAHITVVRFRKPGMDWKQLEPVLKKYREHDFGVMKVDTLQLIWGDWYASADVARTLQEYHLSA